MYFGPLLLLQDRLEFSTQATFDLESGKTNNSFIISSEKEVHQKVLFVERFTFVFGKIERSAVFGWVVTCGAKAGANSVYRLDDE